MALGGVQKRWASLPAVNILLLVADQMVCHEQALIRYAVIDGNSTRSQLSSMHTRTDLSTAT